MSFDELIAQLKALKLYGMATALAELITQSEDQNLGVERLMSHLLQAETAEREVRSITYQMKAARFPLYRDLVGFDFRQSPVDEALVRRLHQGAFMASAQNIVLVGGPGTGKTHLATALGVEAIRTLRKRVRCFSTVELVNQLELEKQAGKAGQLAYRLTHIDLVILDELGYLPFSQAGGALVISPDQQAL